MNETDHEVMERAFTEPLKRGKKPRYAIQPVPSAHIPAIWPAVKDLVEQACIGDERFPTQTVDDVLMALTMLDSQLWLAVDQRGEQPELAGVCVTCIRVYPRLKAVEGAIAGKNWMAWRPVLEETVGVWGRQVGATHFIALTDSKPLQALYRRRGYTELTTVFVKEIPGG